jgi:hypothetical protein
VIPFEHGTVEHHGKPLLAGILAHGVLEVSDAQVISFLARPERLTIDEWLEILERARERRPNLLPAVRRLRDSIALDELSVLGMMANERIAAIARTFVQELRKQKREAAGVVRFAGEVIRSSRQLSMRFSGLAN